MTRAARLPPPPGWGDDELSAFLESAHQNQYATFVGKRDTMAKLVSMDALFARVTKDWINPPSQILAMLFIRCHGAYRTACSLAMSGQAAECYVQCRSVLEYAAYGVHINRNPSLGNVWLDRHVDEAGLKASKKAFQHVAVVDSVKAANRHAAERFETIYQRTIDFGGHPNERSVTANIQVTEEPDRRQMLAILLHGDGVQLDMALKTVAQCGMIALELLETIYGPKFQLLGIKTAMLDLRRRGI
ncbi:hypothetical protein GIW81_11105 [Hyphomicrobium sp. xq]|uniref:Uncharacterized protein n=1 Tax=Hyphomicrobium album TaxID=2665159 RepID=A0A6I3KKB4_9HYPH|nr:hypothetical protein [Hyphomicrobium album]MTD94879.1 hypothetical protein [Hyphomicrobium album]